MRGWWSNQLMLLLIIITMKTLIWKYKPLCYFNYYGYQNTRTQHCIFISTNRICISYCNFNCSFSPHNETRDLVKFTPTENNMPILPLLSILPLHHTHLQTKCRTKASQEFAGKKNEIETGAQVSTFFCFRFFRSSTSSSLPFNLDSSIRLPVLFLSTISTCTAFSLYI